MRPISEDVAMLDWYKKLAIYLIFGIDPEIEELEKEKEAVQ